MSDPRPYEFIHCCLQECLNGNIDPPVTENALALIETMREPHLLADQHGGTWGEHPDAPLADWQCEVANDETRLGYWEWVDNQPKPGPTYHVWTCDLLSEADGWGDWLFDSAFTCEDDPDGTGARRSAHAYAKALREQFHCSLIAVRSAADGPPPRRPHHDFPRSQSVPKYTHFFDARISRQFTSDIENFEEAIEAKLNSFSSREELRCWLLTANESTKDLIRGIIHSDTHTIESSS